MAAGHHIKRQAVVVIHGIGEQRPMETLRSFVAGIKQQLEASDPEERNSTVRSKPDSVGDIYETVRLSMDSTAKRPIADFYEFYWAHNMRDTRFSHMGAWFWRLLFSNVSNVPPRLKILWITAWGLIVMAAAVAYFVSSQFPLSKIEKAVASVIGAGILSFLLSFIGSFTKSIFLSYAGDAARYFTPTPDNVGERSSIRAQGIQFLQKLHAIAKVEKVDRIILVGHSLGSVVAYDLLRLLWTEYNTQYDQLPEVHQQKLEEMNKYANDENPLYEDSLEAFQALQYECWKELCCTGNKWRISDFITVGAAINALDYFMVTQETIETLKAQRELPTCPPIKDDKDNNIYYKSYPPYTIANGEKRQVKLLNHAALFAVTRWTNIYYTSDFVGGAMQRVFGKGIRDIAVKRWSLWILPGGHTSYWDKEDKQNVLAPLVAAMQLNCKS